MTQDCIFTGRITRLAIFRVPEFVDGDIALKFVKHYCEGDIVVVTGFHEPRPSTAAANTPWVGRFRVRDIGIAEDTRLAA